MDEDNDGKACEHLPDKPAFFETAWFRVAIGVAVALGLVGFWWSRKVKAAKADRAMDYLFPGRTRAEEVEDELALLKADRAIDEADNSDQNQG